jgi:cysteine-rich repeat protein
VLSSRTRQECSLARGAASLAAVMLALVTLPSCDVPARPLFFEAGVEAGDQPVQGAIGANKPDARAQVCGNGELEQGEECDDGNVRDGDDCDHTCKAEPQRGPSTNLEQSKPACGNGVIEPGEQCDDGNHWAGDGCDAACQNQLECGNGRLEPGEQCDPPGTPECDENCASVTPTRCGNGVLEAEEECDDGNRVNNDDCSRGCKRSVPPTTPAVCGDGTVDLGEHCEPPGSEGCSSTCQVSSQPECGNGAQESYWLSVFEEPIHIQEACDDGNSEDADGCSSQCLLETNCGNGAQEGEEACDDGNFRNGDGCSSRCEVEACADGVLNPGEECDDGNFRSGDGCSSRCLLEACGDNVRNTGEGCDDGNTVDGDGCSSTCVEEPPVSHKCGNGTRDEGEECDDGNRVNGDGCSALCQTRYCGDGITHPDRGEECDDGVNTAQYGTASAGCSVGCKAPGFCGDGVRQYFHERCDDGPTGVPPQLRAGDGCDLTCQRESTCGNGSLEFDEQCDDSNTVAGDDCSATCTVEPAVDCGDGLVDTGSGEDCEDGNFIPGDGCSPACKFEVCGNGYLDPGEECEPKVDLHLDAGAGPVGQPAAGPSCSDTCALALECGDGIVSQGEECDDEGEAEGPCTDSCLVAATCGDGFVDSGETCDDNNTTGADGCSPTCQNEAACGNGLHETGEDCDDGNLSNGDACSSKCRSVTTGSGGTGGQLQNPNFDVNIAGWAGTDNNAVLSFTTQNASGGSGSGSVAVTFGLQTTSLGLVTAGAQQCVPAQAGQELELSAATLIATSQPASARAGLQVRFFRSADCTGATDLPSASLPTSTARGEWTAVSGEFTTPTGTGSMQVWLKVSKAGTAAAATVLFDSVALSAEGASGEARCGDGAVNRSGEACDDGNAQNGDGCDAECHDEAVCGDGVKTSTELYDDGNVVNGDRCSSRCSPTSVCGNGILEAGEACDDGNRVSTDSCSRLCEPMLYCGNGTQEAGEACDDGNGLSGDGCSSRCRLEPTCGNGTLEGEEQCDDGNLLSDDGCSQLCLTEAAGVSCGDGIIQASLGEECEYTPGAAGSRRCRKDCTLSCFTCQSGPVGQCEAEVDACAGAPGKAESGPGEGRSRAELCLELFNCVHESTLEACTSEDPFGCLGTQETAGRCRDAMLAAAETLDADLALERVFDPEFVSGAAFEMAICTAGECGPAHGTEAGACEVKCGNGYREGSETCDDGNDVAGDGCTQCVAAVCGNGKRDLGEECDPSDPADTDRCNAECEFTLGCGDGVLNAHLVPVGDAGIPADAGLPFEACDSEFGCSDECEWQYCGDGVVQPQLPVRVWDGVGEPLDFDFSAPKEECDGAPVNGVACNDCLLEYTCEQCRAERCSELLEPQPNSVPECLCSGADPCGCGAELQAAIACLDRTECVDTAPGVSDGVRLTPCYCGSLTNNTLDCVGGDYDVSNPPPGPPELCLGELLKTVDNSSILNLVINLDDVSYAGGRLKNFVACDLAQCPMCRD